MEVFVVLETKYVRVWQNYALLKRQSQIMRTGFARLGIYPCAMDGRVEDRRSESVMEHVGGTLILANAISMFCPELLTEMELLRCVRLLLCHEVGEAETGDIPDDGRRNELQKDQAELEAMTRYCRNFSLSYEMEAVHDFIEFQNKSSPFAQVVYCIDKLEAVLQGLIYEQDGRGGDLSDNAAVVESLSEQDKLYMSRTGSMMLVDNWSAHFFDLVRGFKCAPTFVKILQAAVEDVRGEWFAWYEE